MTFEIALRKWKAITDILHISMGLEFIKTAEDFQSYKAKNEIMANMKNIFEGYQLLLGISKNQIETNA